jgi:ribose transport system permease protein
MRRPRPSATLTMFRSLGPVLGLAVVVLAFSALAPGHPLTSADIRNITLQSSITGIGALGVAIVIVTGGIDLAVGSVVAVSCVVTALALKEGASGPLAALVAISIATLAGAYTGLLTSALRLPAFIVTLGAMGFWRGIAKWLSGSTTVVPTTDGGLGAIVRVRHGGPWWQLAPASLLWLGLAVVVAVFLARTVLGRHLVAIGSNPEAARRCGIPVRRTRALAYVICGSFIGLAGVIQFARLTVGDPTVASGEELRMIAAVVIGGGSLRGGRVSITGTVAGVLLMSFLSNRSDVLGWPNYIQEIITGHIIIAAVLIDRFRSRAELFEAEGA